MLQTAELFDVSRVSEDLQPLLQTKFPWQVLAKLDVFTATVKGEVWGRVHPTAVLEGEVYLAPNAVIGPHAYVKGPAWIGEGAEVGHAVYLRGGVVLAPGVKVGHASEVKHALLLEGAKVPHFNYVGDSILGHHVNLGAGVKLANFKTIGAEVKVAGVGTGLRKFGAALGDEVSIGCNAVTAPGTLIGPRTVVYHGAMLRGVYPGDTVVKVRGELEQVPRHHP